MFESARTCMPLALRQDVYFLISILYKFIIERKIVFWSKWLTRCQSCLGLSSLYYSRYRACGWRVSDGLVNTSDLMRFCTDEFSSTLSNKYSSDLVGIGWILKKKKCKKNISWVKITWWAFVPRIDEIEHYCLLYLFVRYIYCVVRQKKRKRKGEKNMIKNSEKFSNWFLTNFSGPIVNIYRCWKDRLAIGYVLFFLPKTEILLWIILSYSRFSFLSLRSLRRLFFSIISILSSL